MKNLRNVLLHPLIVGSIGVVVVTGFVSAFYYAHVTRLPEAVPLPIATSTSPVTASGTVEASENPDLAFDTGGRIARIAVSVGARVAQGQTLASLDTTALVAARAQAVANLAAQQAKLADMQAGARQVDIAAKQTAVDQAKTTLQNLYNSMDTAVVRAYDQVFSAVSSDTDSLFSQPNTNNPLPLFTVNDNQVGIDVAAGRAHANSELRTWNTETIDGALDTEAALISAIAHLKVVRTYSDTLIRALIAAVPTTNFPQSSITAGQTGAGALRDAVNAQISALETLQQQEASDKIAIAAAQNSLDQTTAGATKESIQAQQALVAAAQAQVDSTDAQIRNAIIVAPFSGEVSSVHEKVNDIVPAGTPVISLSPASALQISAYVSEIDVAKVAVGDSARVTLDAYGTSRSWAATVVSIDRSPTQSNAATGYKIVLQFSASDPAISTGMTANVAITPSH